MSLTRSGTTLSSRAPNCDFQIFTATPSASFEELGTIDVEPGWSGINTYTKLTDFKERIAPEVCRAGGNAAVAMANGFGMYIKAVVLNVSQGAGGSAPPPASSTEGCRYDTQCKGDRICVAGACAEPTKQ